jgi:4-amino-4-deoxy-L-arabinose transferase-like glycosyltransferase
MPEQTKVSQIFSVFALILFLGVESFLKAQARLDGIQNIAVAVCVVSWTFLIYQFSRDSELWNSFLIKEGSLKHVVLIAVVIIAIGAVFRFWKLGSLADGMAWDEAYKGLDALAIRNYGERPVFLNWNAGREALIAYLVAASQLFFDYSVVSVRAVLAFFGVLTLIFVFLFSRRIFNDRVALVATFLLAVSKWHIIHTRYAVRVGLIVFFEVIVLYFLARGMQSSKRGWPWHIAAGFFGGLGLYTYIAYRIFPFIALVFLLDSTNRPRLKQKLVPLFAGALVALFVAAPMLNFSWKNRESFNDRIERTAVWNTRGTDLSPTALVIDSTLKTFGLFTYRGDAIDRHNVKEEPMLSRFASGFFFLGLGIVLINIRKPFAAFLIIYLLLTILPGVLSVNAPHSSRTLGSVVPAILLVSVGVLSTYRLLAKFSRTLAFIVFAAVLGGNFYTGPNDGLLRYAHSLDTLDAKTSALWGVDRDQYRVVQLLNQLGPKFDVYLSAQFYFHSTVEYLTYEKSEHKIYAPGINVQNSWKQNKTALIVVQPAECNLWWLRDDDRKQFYKWWAQSGPYDVKKIRGIITRTYVNTARTTNMTDHRVIQSIWKSYPHAREVNLGSFTVFLVPRPK